LFSLVGSLVFPLILKNFILSFGTVEMDMNDDLNGRKGRKRGPEHLQLISNGMEEIENRNQYILPNGNGDIMGKFSLNHQGGELLHHIGNIHTEVQQYEDDDSEDDDNDHVHNNFNSVAVANHGHNMYENQMMMQQQQQQLQMQMQQQVSRPARKSRRKPPGEICGRTRWTEEMVRL
jgi:hypothetical protein